MSMTNISRIDSLNELISRASVGVDDAHLRNNLLLSLNELRDYIKLDENNQLIKTSLPVGSIVYMCTTEDQLFPNEPDDGISKPEEIPVILQKPFVPGTVFFDIINMNYNKFIFGDILSAVRFINDRVGLDICRKYNFPTIENDIDNNETIHDNGSSLFIDCAIFDKRINEFIENVIHTDLPEDEDESGWLIDETCSITTDSANSSKEDDVTDE